MVVGILGKEVASGAFEALDICLPGMPEQDPLPKNNKHKFVALLSGLNIGEENQLDMRNQLLSEFLTGELGSSVDQASSATISRVILAGNSVSKPNKSVDAKKPVSDHIFISQINHSTPVRKNMVMIHLHLTLHPCYNWMKCWKKFVVQWMWILCLVLLILRHYIYLSNLCILPCLSIHINFLHFTVLQIHIGVK